MRSRAVVMRTTGASDVLALEEVDAPTLQSGEIRIRALASAVNHSDLEIRAGKWPIRRTPQFPYVPGLEVVGNVVEVADGVEQIRRGDRVWTMMQGLGGVRAERDGGYAEYVVVSAAAVALLPNNLDPVAFATVGLAGVTAYHGLLALGPLAGKTVAVTGPTGGVGSVAVLLAHRAAAEVVEVHRESPPLAAGSVDAVLDIVGGPRFPELVSSLRHGGRYCIVGAIAGGDVCFDAWTLLNAVTLTGYSTEDIDGDGLRAATETFAHDLLERRAVRGRVVLTP